MRSAATLLLALFAGAATAHPAPSSIVRLEFRASSVHAEYWVPVSELDFARAADPAGDFQSYLLRHVGAESGDARWRVAVVSVRDTPYLGHAYRVAELSLEPPAGARSSRFVLVDDAVTHEVRNHVVYVVARHGEKSGLVGALQYPVRRLEVAWEPDGQRSR